MTVPPHVALVLLNYNGMDYLQRHLPLLKATTWENKKIYVIDNDSKDDSIAYLQSDHPDVPVIRNSSNEGYAGGYNTGLSKITADYFILLNTDIAVTAGFIEPLMALMQSDERIGACQPKILSLTRKSFFEYAGGAGGWIDTLGYTFTRGRIFDHCEKDKGQYDADTEIFWASGACMVLRSSLFAKLGGFYEYLFMYSEEVDLCWRIQAQGYKIMSCGNSIVYHQDTPSLQETPQRVYYLFRNNLIMLQRNLPAMQFLLLLPCRLVLNGLSCLIFLLKGHWRSAGKTFLAHAGYLKWLFFAKKPPMAHKTPLKGMRTAYRGSVVLQYFLYSKKSFTEIVQK